ncbi:Hypothetical protein PACV_426 [Pacmanvirus A23]|uniref:Hypothetical protein n=1 Tax=Pacmanvirus A23 TaxID=1932881 RepID=UPI000A092280|nr:Hypothetical protein B9W72_gp422 [Pacmanvirus A23]SIP86139.1 Hypothetical protein PACV_426 [Pacmanvirus A23]
MEAEIERYRQSNGWEKAIYIVKLPRVKVNSILYKDIYKIGFTSDLYSRLLEDFDNLQFESIIYVHSVSTDDIKAINSIINQVAKKYSELRNILGNVVVETINIGKYIELINGYNYNNDFSDL